MLAGRTQKNQALWVDIHIPKDAAPGAYRGRITVEAGGRSRSLPIRLSVWAYTIPSKMHAFAEFMTYGAVVRQPHRNKCHNFYKLTHAHRIVISDNKARPKYGKGRGYDWARFDARYGKLFDGSLFTEGPTAGVPIPSWYFPITYKLHRIDKKKKGRHPPYWVTNDDWPLPAPKTQTKWGVRFTPSFKHDLLEAMKKWEAHFAGKGWTRTRQVVFQNCLDEAGFHKWDKALKAGREQATAIHETAKLIQEGGFKLLEYKLDIGGGFSGCRLDLDGDGKKPGPQDVANYFGPLVRRISVHGMDLTLAPLQPYIRKNGVRVNFYNGYPPRLGPNTIHGELLGLRAWGVCAWRGGLSGWSDWEFQRGGPRALYRPNREKGRTCYVYQASQLGLTNDHVYASLRMKSQRRGLQDYEMLRLLVLKDGHEKRAQALASLVCGSPYRRVPVDLAAYKEDLEGISKPFIQADPKANWSHDPEAWERFRRLLGKALCAKRARKKT